MKYIVGLSIYIIIILLVFKKPQRALFIYLLLYSTRGIEGYVNSISISSFPFFFQLIEILVVVLAWYRLKQEYLMGIQPYRVYLISNLIAILSVIIFSGNYFFGNGAFDAFSAVKDFELILFIPAMVYWRDEESRYLFVVLLLIHLMLAFVMLIYPESFLDKLSAINYFNLEKIPIINDFKWSIARINGDEPVMTHFSNQNGYSQVSAISLLIGIWLYHKCKTHYRKIISILLVFVSIIGMMAGFGRMSGVALLAGLFSFYMIRVHMNALIRTFLAALLLIIISLSLSGDVFFFINDLFSQNQGGTEYRFSALSEMPNYILRFGAFGITPSLHFSGAFYFPHENITYITYRFGVVAGLLVAFLEIISLFGKRINNEQNIPIISDELLLNTHEDIAVFRASAICMIIAGLANGFAGGHYYWMWFFICCTPWLYSSQNSDVFKGKIKN